MTASLLIKSANVGGSGDELEFEKAFAGIAYSTIRNKAPRLLDYMVGFQLIDRNEDNSKAVGAFGFKIGKQWLLAPVFFLNGEIKGHEILYLKSSDTCVPLKEDWVNSVLSQAPYELGENSGVSTLNELGGSKPMLRSLAVPPSQAYGKWASDMSSYAAFADANIPAVWGGEAEWVQPFMPLFAAVKANYASSLYATAPNVKLAYDQVVADPFAAAFAEVGDQFDLTAVLGSDPSLLKAAHDVAESTPFVKAALQYFYGPDCFSRWAGTNLHSLWQEQSQILPVSIAKQASSSDSLIPDEAPAPAEEHPVKSGAVRIYYSHSVLGSSVPLDAADRTQLMRTGRLVKDARKSNQISKILTQKTHFKLENPHETGLYDVLEADGTTDRMLVVVHGIGGNASGRLVTLVRLDGSDSKSWLTTYLSNVFTEKYYELSEWQAWLKSLPQAKKLTEGNEYIALHDDGSATVPFRVDEKYSDTEYRIAFSQHSVSNESIEGGRALHFERLNATATPCDYSHGVMLRIIPEGGPAKKLRQTQTYMQLPAGCRLLQLSDDMPQPVSLIPWEGSDSRTKGKPILTGDSADITRLIYTKTAGLEVWRDGTELLFKTASGVERVRQNDALWNLIAEHGLSEADADAVVKSASDRPQQYRIEYANGFGPLKEGMELNRDPRYTDVGADFEAMNPRTSIQLSPRTEANARFSYSMQQPIPELMASNQDLSNWNVWQNYTAEDFGGTKQLAQIAASRGQKEVFDVSMFTGLIKAVSKDTLVERYLPALVRALDSLGRLLLSFYWHSAEFADRYGKNDLPELEDSLRNAFDALGSVTLFLKEKTIESPLRKSDVDLDDSARV